MTRHFYAVAWIYGRGTWIQRENGSVPGLRIHRFATLAEARAWADGGPGSPYVDGYRETLSTLGPLAYRHVMRCVRAARPPFSRWFTGPTWPGEVLL